MAFLKYFGQKGLLNYLFFENFGSSSELDSAPKPLKYFLFTLSSLTLDILSSKAEGIAYRIFLDIFS